MTGDSIWVFTFKEGLLSRVAHDLRLHVDRFSIVRESTGAERSSPSQSTEDIVGRFEANSLIVDGVMHDGRLDPGGLGARDKAKIGETIRSEILRTRSHPTIEYRGRVTLEGARVRVDGTLTMVGVKRPLLVIGTREGERVRASVTLRPSEFGIAPYKALAGAIRLQDRVLLEIDVSASLLG
jgi:hypothetical protein